MRFEQTTPRRLFGMIKTSRKREVLIIHSPTKIYLLTLFIDKTHFLLYNILDHRKEDPK